MNTATNPYFVSETDRLMLKLLMNAGIPLVAGEHGMKAGNSPVMTLPVMPRARHPSVKPEYFAFVE